MPEPTYQDIVDALRADPGFQDITDSFLMVSLVLAHGKQAEARGVGFLEWLGHIQGLLEEYA